jgi:hypothetical protein
MSSFRRYCLFERNTMTAFANTFTNIKPAEVYLQSRHRDLQSLTHEIGQARKGNEADLGYCVIIDNRFVKIGASVHEMKSWTDALAFILRKFW